MINGTARAAGWIADQCVLIPCRFGLHRKHAAPKGPPFCERCGSALLPLSEWWREMIAAIVMIGVFWVMLTFAPSTWRPGCAPPIIANIKMGDCR